MAPGLKLDVFFVDTRQGKWYARDAAGDVPLGGAVVAKRSRFTDPEDCQVRLLKREVGHLEDVEDDVAAAKKDSG